MENKKITLEEIVQLDFNSYIWIAAPVMLSLVALEFYLSSRNRRSDIYSMKDLFSSLSIGIGNLVINFLTKAGIFYAIVIFYNLTPWSIPHTWWSYVLCFFILDLLRYWAHRIAHEQRFWWSTHVVHHSSTHYNLSVSFRLSWIQNLKLIFFLPIALLSFEPVVFFITHQVAVLYQFWIHTQLIRKLPKPIEFIFTTPSHHRVHHGINDKYIDKNYGSTLIIWDRMFGTFQAEEEAPVYGIRKQVHSFDPVFLVFHEWVDMFRDVWKQPKKVLSTLFGKP